MKSDRLIPPISGVFLCLIFIISIFLFIRYQKKWHQYVLFFPQYKDEGVIETEFRRFPKKESVEQNMYNLIQEALLGPQDLRHEAVLPEGTRVQSLLFRGGVLFVDFSSELLLSDQAIPLSLQEKFSLVERGLKFNFKEIEKIVFTVEGELPGLENNN